MTHILFWDIDGTLLSTARAGVFALEEAAREICGVDPAFHELRTDGLTDSEVAELAISTCGATAAPETVSAFLRAYERHLPGRLAWRRGRVLRGVVELLDELSARPDVNQYLLTGNTRTGAEAKLRHYGLEGYFAAGAFCGDGDDRTTIARRALGLARETIEQESAEGTPSFDAFVIGDTPHDVRCGQAIGARTIAVASGSYSVEALQDCGPWLLLSELPPPEVFVQLLELDQRGDAIVHDTSLGRRGLS